MEFVRDEAKKKRQPTLDALQKIQRAITADGLLTKDAMAITGLSSKNIHSLIYQGRLIASRGNRKGKNSLRIIEVKMK
jgi:hypothetical protein